MAIRENLVKTLFDIDKEQPIINSEFLDKFLDENESFKELDNIKERFCAFFLAFRQNGWLTTGIEMVTLFLDENPDIKELSDKEAELKVEIEKILREDI